MTENTEQTPSTTIPLMVNYENLFAQFILELEHDVRMLLDLSTTSELALAFNTLVHLNIVLGCVTTADQLNTVRDTLTSIVNRVGDRYRALAEHEQEEED